MDGFNNDITYQLLVKNIYKRCQEVQVENERLVSRTNRVKKFVQRYGRDIDLVKKRLDRYNDNWRAIPMILPHPKRKIEQKRGPKPKLASANIEALNKGKKQRVRKSDKEGASQEVSLQRQQQQQKKELQKQRQREQQAMKQAAQQQRQLLRKQKQIAAQTLKQQRQLQRQRMRLNTQQMKKQVVYTVASTPTNGAKVNSSSTNSFSVTQRNILTKGPMQRTRDVIMPPPPPPPKVDQLIEQQSHLLLMHRPLQVTTLKNQQKFKIT